MRKTGNGKLTLSCFKKILLVILTFYFSSVSANSNVVSLKIEKGSLQEAFNKVRLATAYAYTIAYNKTDIEGLIVPEQEFRNKPIDEILQKLIENFPLKLEKIGSAYVIKKADPLQELTSETVARIITGIIRDEDTNDPVTGATVSVNGRSVKSDDKGFFSIEVEEGKHIITISFVGYNDYAKEVTVAGNEPLNIDVRLKSFSKELDNVIVTALGIKRDEKKLGYAQQTIKAETLSAAPATNWSSGLMGKVAGLNIISGGTGPINSQKIQLRGTSSLNIGANNALIVVDGVPMNQETTSYGNNVGAAYGTDAPVDYGNSVSELNQQDIESVTVLKGPSAAALYGSRAANGVLIITTKSGKKNQKLGVTVNSSVTIDKIINWPDYQYEYGAGGIARLNSEGKPYYSWGNSEDGPSTNTPEAFGPKFEGQYYYQYDPETQSQGAERTLWRPYKNNMKDFFNTGVTTENAVSLQGGNEKGSMRLNMTHTDNKYIVPNTGFKKNSVSLNANYQISNRIKLATAVNYNNRNSDNLPALGISNGSLGYFLMFLMPSVDINWYKPIWKKGKEGLEQLNPFSDWSSNPYFLTNIETNPLSSDQLIGNVRTDVKITEKLSFMGRVSMNSLTQLRETHRGYSSKKYPRGYYGRQDISSREINADFLLTYKDEIGKDFSYEIVGGGNHMSYEHRDVMSSVDALIVPGVYKLSNGVNNPLVKANDALKEINSFYGMASLSWKNQVFLDLTGRNDWSSTLPVQNNSYFYPSVTGSVILSDMFNMTEPISYLKYRLSYAQVGSDAVPYQTSKYYSQSGFPSSAIVPATLFNTNLKPEITSSWETGFDLRVLNNRLGLDLTLYASSTKNQILSLPADVTAGYSSRVINAGEVRNKGAEIVLTGTPVRSKNLDWNIIVNWSANRNKIIELTDNLEQQTLTNVWISSLIATVGGTTSDLWGIKFVRDPEGNIVYQNGVPTKTGAKEYIGRTSPDWKAGISNTVRYKNFRLSATLDGQYKGLIFSGTYSRASWAGTTSNTLPGRDEGTIVGKGVVLDANNKYVPNTTPINTQTYYTQYFNTTPESGTFDASFIKIREIALSYNFPKNMIRKWRMENLSFSVFGRNLAVFDKFPMFDPEAGTMNGTVFVPGIEITPMPYTASYGCNLKIEF